MLFFSLQSLITTARHIFQCILVLFFFNFFVNLNVIFFMIRNTNWNCSLILSTVSTLSIISHIVFGMCFIFELYIAFFLTVIAFDGNKWNTQLKFVDRPITEIWYTICIFLFDCIICKQYACSIRWDENQHMPNGMQIWEFLSQHCITEKFIE